MLLLLLHPLILLRIITIDARNSSQQERNPTENKSVFGRCLLRGYQIHRAIRKTAQTNFQSNEEQESAHDRIVEANRIKNALRLLTAELKSRKALHFLDDSFVPSFELKAGFENSLLRFRSEGIILSGDIFAMWQ